MENYEVPASRFGRIIEWFKGLTLMSFAKLGVFLMIVGTIIGLIYWDYQRAQKQMANEPTLIREPISAKVFSKFASDKLSITINNEGYTLSVWLLISDWNYRYGADKEIIRYGAPNNYQLRLSLDAMTPIARFSVMTPVGTIVLPLQPIPLNEWFNLTFTISGIQLEGYLNGRLLKSITLSKPPIWQNGDIFICEGGGYNGKLTQFKLWNRVVTAGEIFVNYTYGVDGRNEGIIGNYLMSIFQPDKNMLKIIDASALDLTTKVAQKKTLANLTAAQARAKLASEGCYLEFTDLDKLFSSNNPDEKIQCGVEPPATAQIQLPVFGKSLESNIGMKTL